MSHASVRRWLEEHTLIEPSLLEGAGLDSLVAERIAAIGGNEPAYIAELDRSSEEVDRLVAGIAVPETWLFRYPRSYDLLLEFLGRRLAAGVPTLRMLSVGCATGQEPYCMAMTALHAGWPADRVSVEGVDRNREFLRAAEAGEYGSASIRTEIPAWAVPFSIGATAPSGSTRRCAVVRFRRADATGPEELGGAGPCDVVFCRNVFIYLNSSARERLLDSICAALVPGGLLFVGHAEQAVRGAAPLRPVAAPHAFALERVDASPIVADRPQGGRRSTDRASAPTPRPAVQNSIIAPPEATRDPAPAPEATIEDARELADSGRAHDGEAMIRAVIARRGPSAPAMELLGMIRISLNDTAGAKRLFEQAVYLEPDRSASLLQLALISERSGDTRRAAVYWDRARRASAVASGERAT